MTAAMDGFRAKFRVDELKIDESAHWVWSLRPGQCTLGAGVLSAKRFATRFADLPEEAGADMMRMIKRIEGALGAAFAYDKINYLMLMMVDPPVHYHVVPRYARQVEFAGRAWKDAGWPALPGLAADDLPDETLHAVRDAIAKNLG